MLKLLAPGDEAALERFLCRHADSSMFLRANVRRSGLEYRDAPVHGSYAALFDGADMVAVAGHAWNGMVLLQAPQSVAEVARGVVDLSGRPVKGFLGPWDQVVSARSALGYDDRHSTTTGPELLHGLDLSEFVVPPLLAEGLVKVRLADPSDLSWLVDWAVEYRQEALGEEPGPELTASARETTQRHVAEGSQFVLEENGRPVCWSGFNARLPDCVQVGPVYTPSADRSRGYSRALVAGTLLRVREEGVTRAVLFTEKVNLAARRSYEAIGFRAIEEFGLVMFPN